jgi:hypothetical protein
VATTISRLAAVLTTDTGQFQAGFQRAGQIVQTFGNRSAGSSNLLWKLEQKAISATGSFGRFGGILTTLGGAGGPLGMFVVGATAAATATANWLAKLARLADSARDARIEIERAHAEAAKLAGVNVQAPTGETTKDIEGRVAQEASSVAERTGLTMHSLLRFSEQWLKSLGDVQEMSEKAGQFAFKAFSLRDTNGLFPSGTLPSDGLAAERQRTAELQKQTKEFQEQEKWLVRFMEDWDRAGDAMQQASDRWIADFLSDWDAGMERMQNRIKSLGDSLATPAEKFRATIKELMELKDFGLSDELFNRAVKRAEDELRSAKVAEFKTVSPVGAFERGTAAEFSARVRGNLESRQQLSVAREQLKTERQMYTELQKLNAKSETKFSVAGL